MARVVKKDKKEKQSSKKPLIITLSSILGVGLIIGIVFLVIFLLKGSPSEKYTDSRSMSYSKLLEITDNDSQEGLRYENTFYIYVFNSDYDKNPDSELKEEFEGYLNDIIKYDGLLNDYYTDKNNPVPLDSRTGFYTLDLMDDDEDKNNIGILTDAKFGNHGDGPFLIKVTNFGTNVNTSDYAPRDIGQDLRDINIIFKRLIDTHNLLDE